MAQYLMLVLRPSGYDPAKSLDDFARRDIDALNEEMRIAGVCTFVGGLRPMSAARDLYIQPDGSDALRGAPVVSGTHFIDGLWILNCDTIEVALNWGRKAASACRAVIEVRPFY